MTGSRKVLLALAALAVPAYFLPLTRDELSWWWTRSHEHADNYLRYLSDWPNGRHVVEARLFYEQRQWAEIKAAQIRLASMATPANAEAEAAYRRARAVRQDDFWWKQATSVNTIASYQGYLNQYPQGRHAREARLRIQTCSQPAGP